MLLIQYIYESNGGEIIWLEIYFLYSSYLPAPIRPQGKSNTPPLKLSAVIRNFWLSIATGRELINCDFEEHLVFLDVF